MLNQTSNITKSGGDWKPSSIAYSQLPSDALIPCDEKKRILSSLLNGVNMTPYNLIQRTQLTNAPDFNHWKKLNQVNVVCEKHQVELENGECQECREEYLETRVKIFNEMYYQRGIK